MNQDLESFAQLLGRRYSCRGFESTPVERATIERLLEVAQRTPSWCNAQPWQVHITSGAATERFRAALLAWAASHPAEPDYPFPREYRGIYLERRRECGFQLAESNGHKDAVTIVSLDEYLMSWEEAASGNGAVAGNGRAAG